jgi:DNA repair exonuclease SbcCD ATPase subunit
VISHVRIRGFRGVSRELELSLATITLLSGRNGLGKTTVFDAVDWCLFGNGWRLAEDSRAIKNLYVSASAEVSVRLTVSPRSMEITRSEEGLFIDGVRASDRDVAMELLRDPEVFPPYSRDYGTAIRRVMYLTQSEMQHLVGSGVRQERSALLAALAGVPNASLVTSSIRRVSDRINERMKAAGERLEELRTALEEVAKRATRSPGVLAPKPEDIRSVAERVLGSKELVSLPSSEVLLGSVDELVGSLQATEASLRSLATYVEEVDTRVRTAEEDLRRAMESHTRDLQATTGMREALQTQRAKVQEYAVERGALLARVADVDARVTSNRTAQREASVTTELAKRHESETASLRAAQQALDEQLRRFAGLRHERDRLLEALKDETGHGTEVEQTVRQLHAIEERARTKEALTRLAETTGTDVAAALREEEGLRAQAASRERELAVAEEGLRAALAQAADWDRLLVHVAEAGKLTRDLGLSNCPLCGAAYEDRATLLEHMRSTYATARKKLTTTESRRQEVERARAGLEEIRTAASRASALRIDAQRRLSDATTQLGLYGDRLDSEAIDIHRRIQVAERERSELDAKISGLRGQLVSAEQALVTVQHGIERGERTLQDSQGALDRTKALLDDRPPTNVLPPEQAEALEAEALGLRDQLSKLDVAVQTAGAEERRLRDQLERRVATEASNDAEMKGLSALLAELKASRTARLEQTVKSNDPGAIQRDCVRPPRQGCKRRSQRAKCCCVTLKLRHRMPRRRGVARSTSRKLRNSFGWRSTDAPRPAYPLFPLAWPIELSENATLLSRHRASRSRNASMRSIHTGISMSSTSPKQRYSCVTIF